MKTHERKLSKLLRMAAVSAVLFSLLCGCSSPAVKQESAEATESSAETLAEESHPLEIKALENEEQRAVLSLSIDDFVTAYNQVYRLTHKTDYLAPAPEWTSLNDVTRLWEYPCVCYSFSADPQIYSLPKVLVYTPEGGEEIYEIELLFDDHSFQEAFYEEYQRICHNTLNVLLPDLNDEEISALYDRLYAQTGELFLGDYYVDPDGSKPMPDKIYRCGEMGFYGYYGSGTANICIIPLTEAATEQIAQSGTELASVP